MIYLNYVIQIVFLIVLFSIESTLATPIFTLFFVFKLLDKFNSRDDQSFYYLILSLLLVGFLLALFYQLSISLSISIIFIYYYLRSLVGNKLLIKNFQQWQILQLCLFAALQIAIFFLSRMNLNLFMIGQGLIVLSFMIFKTIAINKL